MSFSFAVFDSLMMSAKNNLISSTQMADTANNNLSVGLPTTMLLGTGLYLYFYTIPRLEQARQDYQKFGTRSSRAGTNHYSSVLPNNTTLNVFYQTYPIMLKSTFLTEILGVSKFLSFGTALLYSHGINTLMQSKEEELKSVNKQKDDECNADNGNLAVTDAVLEPFGVNNFSCPSVEIMISLIVSVGMTAAHVLAKSMWNVLCANAVVVVTTRSG